MESSTGAGAKEKEALTNDLKQLESQVKKFHQGFLNVGSVENLSNTSDNSFKNFKLFNFILKDHSNTTGQPMGSSK